MSEYFDLTLKEGRYLFVVVINPCLTINTKHKLLFCSFFKPLKVTLYQIITCDFKFFYNNESVY